MTGGAFDFDVRLAVLMRSGGLCERCRANPADQMHHRRPRGMGGTSVEWVGQAANAAHLCAACHRWVEAHRASSLMFGWLIPLDTQATADLVPMVDLTGAMFTHDNAGGREAC